VRTRDATHEKLAIEILSRHAAYDARIHGVPDGVIAGAHA
jgi:hypothetical protein